MAILTTSEFTTRLAPGKFSAVTEATISLYRNSGDSRVHVEYATYQPGELIVIPETVNGFWYGLDPNGTFCDPKIAKVERIQEPDGSFLVAASNADR
jgi:hypothetical protein